MGFNKYCFFALGAATLTIASTNGAMSVSSTPIFCPNDPEIICTQCKTGKWSCDVKQGNKKIAWQSNHCGLPLTSHKHSFKFKGAVLSPHVPRPYCQYNAYSTDNQTGASVNLELFNSAVTKSCTLKTSIEGKAVGFNCPSALSPAP